MQCLALNDPMLLASLIRDLDGMTMSENRLAFRCIGPSIDDPGRQRLWIIPKDANAGANPPLWIRRNQTLFQREFTRQVVHCNVVFPGSLPGSVQHHYIMLIPENDQPSGVPSRRRRNVIRRELRCLSSSTHLWVDRLRLHNIAGDVNKEARENLITRLATQYWNEDKEHVYMPPSLYGVKGGSSESVKVRDLLLEKNRPTCSERGLSVLYGPGGIGKTFFLHRLVNKMGMQAKSDILASIPVFVDPPALLHKQALENWLAQHHFSKLTLEQITILIKYGFIVPLLDALDEVVKGEARQGSQQFLQHIVELTLLKEAQGRGVLACRDYYLNSDRLVPDAVRISKDCCAAELSFGLFNRRDRRSFLQVRAELEPSHASRWATALETQASEILGQESSQAVEELIGHPVVLDTLASYIKSLPSDQRVTLADDFKITSPDIFGQIIDQLLQRERDKLITHWQHSFKNDLKLGWSDPFEPMKQRQVLQHLTFLAAKDGATNIEVKASENDIYRTLKHGVFMFTEGIRQATNKREALKQIIRDVMGTPEVAETISNSERDSIIDQALEHLAEAYASHILANTEPDLPDDLIFSFRHRTYFDYFLSEGVITHLLKAIRIRKPELFIQWCQTHRIFDTFGTCLDFLLWDARVIRQGTERLQEFMENAQEDDDILAGYLISLALSLFLRRGQHLEGIPIEGLSFDPLPKWDLLIMREMLAPTITGLQVKSCSFPKLTIDGIDFRDLVVDSCDFETLRLLSCNCSQCNIIDTECKELRLGGATTFLRSKIELDDCTVTIEEGANIEFHECGTSPQLLDSLKQYESVGANITLDKVTPIQPPAARFVPMSNGRRFVNKIMSLARRGGREQFTIYQYKLRDCTPGSDEEFSAVIKCLQDHGCIMMQRTWVALTQEATEHMYRLRPSEQPSFETHKDFWDPIIKELDKLLGQ